MIFYSFQEIAIMDNGHSMLIPDDTIYMNHASIGPMLSDTYNRIKDVNQNLAMKGEAGIDLEDMVNTWNKVRSRFANLINGSESGVTITTNTASALHIVADGLSHLFKPGQNIVLPNIEFTTNSYVWQQLSKRYQLELRIIEYKDGLNDWEELIDDNTILVCVSFVQFSNGYRADLKSISTIAHDHGAFVVVDAIQGLGLVPFDNNEFDVDFIAAGAYKWLLGPMGFGYFYCKPELLNELDSILVGWFSDQNFENMAHHEFKPWEDARRFQQSLSPHYAGLEASLEFFSDKPPVQIYDHVIDLQDYLVELIENLNYEIETSMRPKERSGIIKLQHPRSENIVQKLHGENIIVSYRDGGIRISPHFHNTKSQIDILVEHLDDLQ